MAVPTIDPLPPAPSTASPSNFAALADAFLAALVTMRTQWNAAAAYVDALLAGAANVGNATTLLGQTWANTALTGATTTGTLKAATTVSVGAATPAANGAGVTFPATANMSTNPNTLDDYEEGSFTVTDASGAGLTLGSYDCRYTKIGPLVNCSFYLSYPSTANGLGAIIGGLPFATDSAGYSVGNMRTPATPMQIWPASNATTAGLYKTSGVGQFLNSDLSTLSVCGSLAYHIT